MRIAIISDIHDNWARLDQVVDLIKKEKDIKTVICCGDVCAPSTLEKLAKTLPKHKIYLVWGNVDGDHAMDEKVAKKAGNVEIMGEFGKLELDGRKIAFCHYPAKAKELAKTKKFDVVFYGHTHKPWEEKIGSTIILNPGEITGFFYTPSFAIYDLAKMKAELKLL